MRKLLRLAPFLLVLSVAHAESPDNPAFPDGGSLATTVGTVFPGDGGGPWLTVDTYQTEDWTMSIRCKSYCGSPNVHYRLSTDGGTATTDNNVLDVNRTFDLPVSQGNGEKYRWLSLLGEDGGAPCCGVFHNPR